MRGPLPVWCVSCVAMPPSAPRHMSVSGCGTTDSSCPMSLQENHRAAQSRVHSSVRSRQLQISTDKPPTTGDVFGHHMRARARGSFLSTHIPGPSARGRSSRPPSARISFHSRHDQSGASTRSSAPCHVAWRAPLATSRRSPHAQVPTLNILQSGESPFGLTGRLFGWRRPIEHGKATCGRCYG